MTDSARHAAKASLRTRCADRLHGLRVAPALRRKAIAGIAALAVGGGGVAVATVWPGEATQPPAVAAEPDLMTGREAAQASRDLERLSLDDLERVDIAITVDGETRTRNVPKLTLAEALADAGVIVGAFDEVSEPLGETVRDVQEVTITRGETGALSDETVTEFKTVEKKDPTLEKGTTKVQSEGQKGISRTTYRVSTAEGQETDRTELATVVVQEAQDRVVLIGTKEKPKPTTPPAPQKKAQAAPKQEAEVEAAPAPSGDARSIARGMLASFGWGQDQFQCLNTLWNRESGWNSRAQNASSGAYGIPQALPGSKMASAGADWRTNPATQIRWGLGYISGRYGSPCAALNHSYAMNWY